MCCRIRRHCGSLMAQRPPARVLDQVAHKWRHLAEQRRAHFIELHASGRWSLYYTEEEFLYRLREAIQAAETWARIAPLPGEEKSSEAIGSLAAVAPRNAA